MHRDRDHWWVPLAGVGFIIMLFVGFAVSGAEPPEADSPVQEIVDHYVDDEDQIKAGAGITVIAAGLLLFFAAYLRKVLRAAEGEGHMLSALVLVGATILATGAAIDATISYALADAADKIDPAAVQALQALWDNDFLPAILGAAVFLLASGLSIVRHGALPAWLGWVAVVLGVVAFATGFVEPAFIAMPLGALWILVTSVMLALRARKGVTGAGPTGAPARTNT